MVVKTYSNSGQYIKNRSRNKSEMLEDYVEVIKEFISSQGEARGADLAKHFGVSHATITKNLKRLVSEKLIKTTPYRSIFLTEKGESLALKMREKHEIVISFLRKIGVSQKTAQIDSEGIEHHVSDETLSVMKKFNKNF